MLSRMLCNRQSTLPMRPEVQQGPHQVILRRVHGRMSALDASYLPPARGRCAAKKFTADAAGSLLGATRFVGEADFCQGHPAQIWWTVILDPGSLLVVHYLENFADMTHFDVLEGSRNGDQEQ